MVGRAMWRRRGDGYREKPAWLVFLSSSWVLFVARDGFLDEICVAFAVFLSLVLILNCNRTLLEAWVVDLVHLAGCPCKLRLALRAANVKVVVDRDRQYFYFSSNIALKGA